MPKSEAAYLAFGPLISAAEAELAELCSAMPKAEAEYRVIADKHRELAKLWKGASAVVPMDDGITWRAVFDAKAHAEDLATTYDRYAREAKRAAESAGGE